MLCSAVLEACAKFPKTIDISEIEEKNYTLRIFTSLKFILKKYLYLYFNIPTYLHIETFLAAI